MKRHLLIAAILVITATSCSTMQSVASNPYVAAANTFASNCTSCHGLNGTTGKATN